MLPLSSRAVKSIFGWGCSLCVRWSLKPKCPLYCNGEVMRKGWKPPTIPVSMTHLTKKPLCWLQNAHWHTFAVSCPLPPWVSLPPCQCLRMMLLMSLSAVTLVHFGRARHQTQSKQELAPGAQLLNSRVTTCSKKSQQNINLLFPGGPRAAQHDVMSHAMGHHHYGFLVQFSTTNHGRNELLNFSMDSAVWQA